MLVLGGGDADGESSQTHSVQKAVAWRGKALENGKNFRLLYQLDIVKGRGNLKLKK